MTVYTVHEPPARRREPDSNPDRFAFVRDGFHFWAFLFGPLWMLRYRLWLVLLLYAVVTGALQFGLWRLGMSTGVKFTVGVLIALLVGFEAASLRRWTYGRRRWTDWGVVVASDRDSAERRFFDSWIARQAAKPPASSLAAIHIPTATPDVIGLFPEPQSPR